MGLLAASLRFARLPNLIIVILTQYILYYTLLYPHIIQASLHPTLSHIHFFAFTLCTAIVTLTGYIINDIIDLPIDKINKPEHLYIEKYINVRQAYLIYGLINLLGIGLALYLAIEAGNIFLSLLFPLAVFSLFLYSKKLKTSYLLGNLLVSIFCAGVAAIILLIEHSQLHLLAPSIQKELFVLFGFYACFAFTSTFYREIIKDIEDLKGDTTLGAKTFPIVAGIRNSKILASCFALAMLIGLLLLFILLPLRENWIALLYALIFVLIPSIYSLFLLQKAKIKTHFSTISQLIKGIMVTGLLLMIIFSI